MLPYNPPRMEEEAHELIKQIDGLGGMVPAIEQGFVQPTLAVKCGTGVSPVLRIMI